MANARLQESRCAGRPSGAAWRSKSLKGGWSSESGSNVALHGNESAGGALILQLFGEIAEEAGRVGSIDEPVVVGQADVGRPRDPQ